MAFYDYTDEISPLGSRLANAYFRLMKEEKYPIEPELIASRLLGMKILPRRQLASADVIAGIDSTQSIIFVDEDLYMSDDHQPTVRLAIAHEIGHIFFDSPLMRSMTPHTADEAFEVHVAMREKRQLEARANMFAGTLLVPRQELIRQTLGLLAKNVEVIQDSAPTMNIRQVIDSLAASKLANYFGVSDAAIGWCLSHQKIVDLLELTPETSVSKLNISHIRQIMDIPKEVPQLPDRIRALVPADLIHELA